MGKVWEVGEYSIRRDDDGKYEVVHWVSANWVGWYDTLDELLKDLPEAKGVVS